MQPIKPAHWILDHQPNSTNPPENLTTIPSNNNKNENIFLSGMSDFQQSAFRDDSDKQMRQPSLQSSLRLKPNPIPLRDQEFDPNVRRVFEEATPPLLYHSPNLFFGNLSDHILLEDGLPSLFEVDMMVTPPKSINRDHFQSKAFFQSPRSPDLISSIKITQQMTPDWFVLREHTLLRDRLGNQIETGFSFRFEELHRSMFIPDNISDNKPVTPKSKNELYDLSPKFTLDKSLNQNLIIPQQTSTPPFGLMLKNFLVRFFTNNPFTEINCLFSDEESEILKSVFARKYETIFDKK